MGPCRIRADRLHLRHLTQTGDTEAVGTAHPPEHLRRRIGTLVVALRFDGGDQVPLLALDIVPAEDPVLRHRVQQQLLQKTDHGPQYPVTGQSITVLDEAAVQAHRLIVADPADQRPHGSAVKIIQPQSDRTQIRPRFGPPEQYRRDQGVHRRLFPAHGPQELHTQTPLPETLRRHAPQGDARQKLCRLDHGKLSFKSIYRAYYIPYPHK